MADSSVLESMLGEIHELRTTLKIEGQKDGGLTVLSFRGRDSLSGLATYDLTVGSSAETAEKLDDALGREVVFTVEKADDDTSLHVMRGIVDEIFPGGVAVGKDQRQTLIRIAPRLAELGHGQGSKVFQNLTVVEITKDLFKKWQIEVDPRLHPEPLKRDYCTQVNESDFAFLSRILAEEGIHFHIEHTKDRSTVVLVNDPLGYSPIPGHEELAYRDAGGNVSVDHISSIRRERRVAPGAVAYRDYNFLKPTRDMTTSNAAEAGPGVVGARELYEYPGSYNDPGAQAVGVGPDVQGATRPGKDRAQLRLQEQRSQALTFSGTSTSLRMRVGFRFEIKDHPDKSFNRKYVVTDTSVGAANGGSVVLELGNRSPGTDGINIDFVAVPADVTIRPSVPAKPKAHLRTAKVVGPKPDEPNVDELGRVRIQFEWDRLGKHDDKSSIWVRMASPVAHHNQGNYIAHRVGAEVLVDFLDGDIDRPIVVSALFNGDNRQPQALPADATRAVLYRGLSVPGNKGKNEISCEDKAGKEEIFLHAQKDLIEKVLHNHTETVGANQSYSIGASQSFSVGGAQSISVGGKRTVTVKGDEEIHIVNSRHENVDDGERVTIKGGRTHTVTTSNDNLTVGAGNRSVDVSAQHKLHAQTVVEIADTTIDVSAGTSIKIHHGGDSVLEMKAGEASLNTSSKITLSNGASTITMNGGKISINAAEEISFGCGSSSLVMQSSGAISGSGGTSVTFAAKSSVMKLDASKAGLSGAGVDVSAVGQTVIGGAVIKIG